MQGSRLTLFYSSSKVAKKVTGAFEMGGIERHHYLQKARQGKIFGKEIDKRRIKLPNRYHQKEINPLQSKGVGDAYLAGKIDRDFATGEVYVTMRKKMIRIN
jgi:hypothetical protein